MHGKRTLTNITKLFELNDDFRDANNRCTSSCEHNQMEEIPQIQQ